MFKTVDLYLGIFLILCGFGISLLNLKSWMLSKNKFSNILLSENVLLMCVGITFMCRAIYSIKPGNVEMDGVDLRMAEISPYVIKNIDVKCGFASLLLSYGPYVMSLVNSFLGLIIDNYMHYRMLWDIKKKNEEDNVQEIGETSRSVTEVKHVKYRSITVLWKKYSSFITIVLQWIIPILITLFMYPMNVKEMSIGEARNLEDTCMSMLDVTKEPCYFNSTWVNTTESEELLKYIPAPLNYLEIIEKDQSNTNETRQLDTILSNVLSVLRNFNNNSNFEFTNVTKSFRRPKIDEKCMKICFTDNKSLLVYMFALAFISYFVPITISVVILTKIHIMQVNRPNVKTYVTRELLYNILFWTPVMFDTFLSLLMCSFSMHGTKTSFFNIIANVYQAVKNFMNTRYFKENVIVPK